MKRINILVGNSRTMGSVEDVYSALRKAAKKVNGVVFFVLHGKILMARENSSQEDIQEQYLSIDNPVYQDDYDCRARILKMAQDALSEFHSNMESIRKQQNDNGTDDMEDSFLHSGQKAFQAIQTVKFAEIALNAKIHPVNI